MTTLKQAFDDLFDPRVPIEAAIERHFSPSFRQRIDGAWIDYPAFVSRMAGLRGAITRTTFTVLDEVVEGDRYAERHLVDIQASDGARVLQEVCVFAKRAADGRFVRSEEATRVLESYAPGSR